MHRYLHKAKDVFDLEISGIITVRDLLNNSFVEAIDLIIERLNRGGKIVVTGIGKSGHIGRKIAATLSSTGSFAVFMHPVEAMHGDLGILYSKDIMLALSYSGETEELLNILPCAKRLNVPIIAITGDVNSKLARWADVVISVKVDKEACPFNLAPTTSTTAQLALGDAIAMVLLDVRGFTKEDYGRLHPGGAIGRAVTLKAKDIMRGEEHLVKVSPKTLVKDVILDMTKKKSGSAVVIDEEGKLVGIFTDGDFRRNAHDMSILNRFVGEFITREPISINGESMAVEVLKLIQNHRIDDIIVIDSDKKVLGIIDSQDLPSFKLL